MAAGPAALLQRGGSAAADAAVSPHYRYHRGELEVRAEKCSWHTSYMGHRPGPAVGRTSSSGALAAAVA